MPSVDAFNSTGQAGLKVLNSVLTNNAFKRLKWKKKQVCHLRLLYSVDHQGCLWFQKLISLLDALKFDFFCRLSHPTERRLQNTCKLKMDVIIKFCFA